VNIRVNFEFEVKMPEDRANANEIFDASGKIMKKFNKMLLEQIIEAYQEKIVDILCSKSGLVAKKGLGKHPVKGNKSKLCRCRTFTRSGYWQDKRTLRGEFGSVDFFPAIIQCSNCGKRFTPVLAALELEAYQGKTDRILRMVTESVAETSYRRGASQLSVLAGVPVCRSTAHQWAASVDLPLSKSGSAPFLAADGTGFKKQGGSRGTVNLVLELGKNGGVRPLGVWAGTSWESMSKEIEQTVKDGQYKLLLCDGERAIDKWLGKFAEKTNRGHWHLPRELKYALWGDDTTFEDRKDASAKLRQLIAVEIPGEDIEAVEESEKNELHQRIREAEKKIEGLQQEFAQKGYTKAVTYLENARGRIFNHLHLWLETGIIAPHTTSIVENIIRELVRRLKKIGWNWSDEGATRMGRIVMIRRYDNSAWEKYWRDKMNLCGRCKISIVKCERKMVA